MLVYYGGFCFLININVTSGRHVVYQQLHTFINYEIDNVFRGEVKAEVFRLNSPFGFASWAIDPLKATGLIVN